MNSKTRVSKTHFSSTAALYVSILLVLLLRCDVSAVYGQRAAPIREIEDTVRQSLKEKPEPNFPFLIIPLPKLKEDFIGIQTQGTPLGVRRVRQIDFYEVSPALYVTDGDRVISETFHLGGNDVWVIGFGPDNSKYLLAGFENSLSGFNMLTKDLNIDIASPESALDVFDLFLKSAHGSQFRASIIPDEMHLQSLAIEDFRLRYPKATRRSKYDKWWSRVPLSLKKSLSFPKISRGFNGFEISYFQYDEGAYPARNIARNFPGHDCAREFGRSISIL
jgi:hypothetical protein